GREQGSGAGVAGAVGAEGERGRGPGRCETEVIGLEIRRAARPEPPRAHTSREQCATGPRREGAAPARAPAPPARWGGATRHDAGQSWWAGPATRRRSGNAATLRQRGDAEGPDRPSPRAAERNVARRADAAPHVRAEAPGFRCRRAGSRALQAGRTRP